MNGIFIRILISLNLVFWPKLKLDISLADGEHMSISGFPMPWYSSSVMGTEDINFSALFLLINALIYFFAVNFLLGGLLGKFLSTKRRISIFAMVLVIILLPPLFKFSSQMILGDWSRFVLIPWEGWGGKVNSIYLSHGMASFN